METLRQQLTRHEARKNRPYRCSRGYLTIGVGWNIDSWKLPPIIASFLHIHGYITEEMIDQLLDIQIEAAIADTKEIFPNFSTFTERRQNALMDMVFNMGATGVLGFKKMRKAIARGDWNEAAEQVRDSVYWRQLGGDPAGTDDGKLERPEEIAMMIREG